MATATEQATSRPVPARDARGRLLPGNTANPGGRSPLPPEIKARIAELGPQAIERLAELMRSDNESIAVRAAEALADRWLGKAPQSLQLEGSEERPLHVFAPSRKSRNGHSAGG